MILAGPVEGTAKRYRERSDMTSTGVRWGDIIASIVTREEGGTAQGKAQMSRAKTGSESKLEKAKPD